MFLFMKVLFLDESGDHNLRKIDKTYPLFVLGGIIMDKDYAETVLSEKIKQFKKKLFGTDQILLHTADISRNRKGFESLINPIKRREFYYELNKLMREAQYSVIACVVHKEEHLAEYGVAALDPYLLSLDIIVEQFCIDIGEQENEGFIIAESRDSTLDHQLELAWLNLKIQGTKLIKANQIQKRIKGLELSDKRACLAGLELADLVVSPIGRALLNKSTKEDYQIIESKFRRDRDGEVAGYGLICLPQKRPAPATQ